MAARPANAVSLCAGAAGLDLGLMLAEPDAHTRCYVEWDRSACERIIAAQRAGYLAPSPIWDDVTTFDGKPLHGHIDTVLAGYPCQPFSHAGQRRGVDDERHLWPHIARIIREIEPEWVFTENVPGHITLGLEAVLRELWDMGWTPAAGIFSAAEVGAPHQRQRVFIVAHKPRRGCGVERDATQPRDSRHAESSDLDLAHTNGRNPGTERQQRGREQRLQPEGRSAGAGHNQLADASKPGLQRRKQPGPPDQRDRTVAPRPASERSGIPLFPPGPAATEQWSEILRSAPDLAPSASIRDCFAWARDLEADGREWWEAEAEPEFCRMADGLATRTQPLRILGNGVHPLAAAYAWRTLAAAHGLRPLDLEAAG